MPKKVNSEAAVKRLYDLVGNEYEFVEEYAGINKKIKMRHNCAKCKNNVFEMIPNNFFNHERRCPVCVGGKKTTNIIKKEIKALTKGEYELIGKYEGSRFPITVRHNNESCENHEYDVMYGAFMNGTRCPKCFGRIKKTTEEFKKDVFDLVGDEYVVIGHYSLAKENIRMKHNNESCDYFEYDVTPNNFIHYHSRCPKCSGKMKKTTYEFKDEVFSLAGNDYKVLTDYITAHDRIVIHDIKKGDIIETTPGAFLTFLKKKAAK